MGRTAADCLACGAPISDVVLARLGSLRCAECRADSRPLDARLVAAHHRRVERAHESGRGRAGRARRPA